MKFTAACLLSASAVLAPVLAVPAHKIHVSSVITDVDSISSRNWDYVILGAGLTGLTVANRLSEDPSISVLVVEAGNDTRSSDLVRTLTTYSQAFGTSLSWNFPTVASSAGGSKTLNAGRGLGGSTSINGAAWTRGAKEQYDGLEELGNDGE